MTNPPTSGKQAAKQEAAHTPTPWRKHDMEADAIVGPDRKAIALVMGRSRTEEEDAANMEFILTAVNHHSSLTAANEGMRAKAVELLDMIEPHMVESERFAKVIGELRALARAASVEVGRE